MSLINDIDCQIKEAMKARATERLSTLRMLKSAVKYAAIEKYGADGEPSDDDVLKVIQKEIKKRKESVAAYEQAGKTEAAAKENAEIKILEVYLPPALTEAEIDTLAKEAITEAGATSKAQMGAAMKILTVKAAGRADGKALSQAVQKLLA